MFMVVGKALGAQLVPLKNERDWENPASCKEILYTKRKNSLATKFFFSILRRIR
ncbi:hypothetical protein GPU89_11420 [Burkholderia cepacia]|nr:hypothetical protein [Burkholderia cepacia]